MQKQVSKTSLNDVTTSSHLMQPSDTHTHVIIQNDSGNKDLMKYILLPTKNLIDFGRSLKTNDLVTYKIDRKDRGTNRGKIVLFGE